MIEKDSGYQHLVRRLGELHWREASESDEAKKAEIRGDIQRVLRVLDGARFDEERFHEEKGEKQP